MNFWKTDPKIDSNGTVKLTKETRGQNTGLGRTATKGQGKSSEYSIGREGRDLSSYQLR